MRVRSGDRHHPGLEQCLSFCLAAEGIVDVDQVSRQLVKALGHHPKENMQIMDTVKNEGLVFLVLLNIL